LDFGHWVFLFIAAIVVGAIAQAINTSKRKQEMESKLKSLRDFNSTQKVIGCDGNSGLAVDEKRKKICLITNNGASVSQRVVYYKDIFSVELFEDGTSGLRQYGHHRLVELLSEAFCLVELVRLLGGYLVSQKLPRK
jgi:hypothetical protein